MINKYVDFTIGTTLKKFCLFIVVFVVTFSVGTALRNAGDTYAFEAGDELNYCLDPEGGKISSGYAGGNCDDGCCFGGTYTEEPLVEFPTAEKEGVESDFWYPECNNVRYEELQYKNDESVLIGDIFNDIGVNACRIFFHASYPEPEQCLKCVGGDDDGYMFLVNKVGEGHKNNFECDNWEEVDVEENACHAYRIILASNTGAELEDFIVQKDEVFKFPFKLIGDNKYNYWKDGLRPEVAYYAGESFTPGKMNVYSDVSVIQFGGTYSPIEATFNINGGTWADETTEDKKVTYDEKYSLTNNSEIAVKEGPNGEQLCGWKVENEGTPKKSYLDYAENDKTLYANWCSDSTDLPGSTPDDDSSSDSSDNIVRIYYRKNGGTGSISLTGKCKILAGQSTCEIKPLPTLEKKNFEFNGWGTDKDCEEGEKEKLTVEALDNLKQYFACWKPIDSSTSDGDENPEDTGETPEVDKNPETGSWLLYIAYIVGALALGYTGYYTYKTIKVKND